MYGYSGWPRYVSVRERRAKARQMRQKLREQGMSLSPVDIRGRKISKTFWGKAWCEHLESFSDYANRLPRGRSYVRHGMVLHLAIRPKQVQAKVSGASIYDVNIKIAPLGSEKWKEVKRRCAGGVGSMLELLRGRLSKNVMGVVTDREHGLFPLPREIKLSCSCPDWAVMCKHVAAVLYGVGARLDHKPKLLFVLRDVSPNELISTAPAMGSEATGKSRRLAGGNLSELFGVELAPEPAQAGKKSRRKSGKKIAPLKKAARARKTRAKKAFVPTARAVAGLRRRFAMSRTEFAQLLKVSAPTVTRWESGRGRLRLRERTEEALSLAAGLSKKEAWEVLGM